MSEIRESKEKLIQLSEFVVKKDAEAQEKLQRAEELSKQLQDLDSIVKCDKENSEKERQELCQDRHRLVQQQVALLKERSKVREMENDKLVGIGGMQRRSATNNPPLQFDNHLLTNAQLTPGYNLSNTSLRKVLASVENDLNKLRRG